MDYVFWVDIILNFNTGFVHYGVMYMKRKDIAMHYIQVVFYLWYIHISIFYILCARIHTQYIYICVCVSVCVCMDV